MSVAFANGQADTAPHTVESALALLAEERRRRAEAERELDELWRVQRNGFVLPQKRCLYTALLGTLYEMREAAGADTFLVDYYRAALKSGYFQRPKSEDPDERKAETKRAKDKVGRVLRELHERNFLFKGKPSIQPDEDDEDKYVTTGVEITLRGNLIGALHRLATYDEEIPVRAPRGPQVPRVQCPRCHSYNVTYDCWECGAVSRPGEELEVVMVPVDLLPQPSQNLRPSESTPSPSADAGSLAAGCDDASQNLREVDAAPAIVEAEPLVELAARPQWCTWNGSKIPVNPATGRNAQSNNPRTWGTYAEAVRSGATGVGYMLAEGDPYTVLEVDGCRDSESGEVDPRALSLVRRFAIPTEVSPSGKGIHGWMRGTKPGDRCVGYWQDLKVELYSAKRFIRMSGRWLGAPPDSIPDRSTELAAFYAELFPPEPPPAHRSPGPPVGSDAEVLARMERSRNWPSIRPLWEGDAGYIARKWPKNDGSPDWSCADAALCRHLSYFSGGDVGQVDRLFRQSGLYRPKWERHDYRERIFRLVLGGRA